MKAFPNNRSEGMELRDYFAAKAMQGILADEIPLDMDAKKLAEWSYMYADAMMKARENNE